MIPQKTKIEGTTRSLLLYFFKQCSWEGTQNFNFRVLPFDKILYLHAIQEDEYYKLPCFLVKFIQYETAFFKHPKNIQGLVNIHHDNIYISHLFSGFLNNWLILYDNGVITQRPGRSKNNLHTGPGYLLDENGKFLMLATVDIYMRSSTRCHHNTISVGENEEDVSENVLEKKFYVKNPTLFIHPDIFTKKKWLKLKEWVIEYVIPISQNIEPFSNSFLGSMANRKMNHKINIVIKSMDQFVSKPKEPSVMEDISNEMNSLLLSNLDKMNNIVT